MHILYEFVNKHIEFNLIVVQYMITFPPKNEKRSCSTQIRYKYFRKNGGQKRVINMRVYIFHKLVNKIHNRLTTLKTSGT